MYNSGILLIFVHIFSGKNVLPPAKSRLSSYAYVEGGRDLRHFGTSHQIKELSGHFGPRTIPTRHSSTGDSA